MMTPLSTESVTDFLARVADIRTAFGFEDDDSLGPWFRGQQRSHWQLCPKLFRDYGGYAAVKRDDIEDELREEFITRAPIFSDMVPIGSEQLTEWEWYFLMQHYGAPTRLLDWTEGALIGLYFAVKDNPGLYDAAVWIFDPWRLNERVIGKEWVIPPSAPGVTSRDRKLVEAWLPARFTNLRGLPESPVAVFPTHIARRISTQRSCFTIHGKDQNGLDKLEGDKDLCLVKIIIPAFRVVPIRRELDACGIDEATIFPDLTGLSRSISTRWQNAHIRLPHRGVYTRLRPSQVDKKGVGVFAIRKIKRGSLLFPGDNEEMLWVDKRSLPTTPVAIRELYDDFAVVKGGRYACPLNFNRLTVSWYLNEPRRGEQPNVRCDPTTYDFFALRDIQPGEELTVDYLTYSDAPPVQGNTRAAVKNMQKRSKPHLELRRQ